MITKKRVVVFSIYLLALLLIAAYSIALASSKTVFHVEQILDSWKYDVFRYMAAELYEEHADSLTKIHMSIPKSRNWIRFAILSKEELTEVQQEEILFKIHYEMESLVGKALTPICIEVFFSSGRTPYGAYASTSKTAPGSSYSQWISVDSVREILDYGTMMYMLKDHSGNSMYEERSPTPIEEQSPRIPDYSVSYTVFAAIPPILIACIPLIVIAKRIISERRQIARDARVNSMNGDEG